ncbi:hypothetical protein PFBG_00593 [Plasmodium falciparum 7G8]|uniref:Uncharacterized protein n=1 Tax=Plasmodium falciparum (isolate 7G8) TaxID=57266 RepID=W7FLB3_PLAF8|nr:hypothetical protein PFBG_00593 [Plasmodium falciparum 7G8]
MKSKILNQNVLVSKHTLDRSLLLMKGENDVNVICESKKEKKKKKKKTDNKNEKKKGHMEIKDVNEKINEKINEEKNENEKINEEKNEDTNKDPYEEKENDNIPLGDHHSVQYNIFTFSILNKKEPDLKKIQFSNIILPIKKMIICPYDEKIIILLSHKSIVYIITNKNNDDLKNMFIIKELIFNSPIITTTWIDNYIFLIYFLNNELIFLSFAKPCRNLYFYKCINNYSHITSFFYKSRNLYISFKTKEIVCFKIRYYEIPLTVFKKIQTTEGNYIDAKYLFRKRPRYINTNHNQSNAKDDKDGNDVIREEEDFLRNNNKNFSDVKKRKKRNDKNNYEIIFNNILREIKTLENKISNNDYNIFYEDGEINKDELKNRLSARSLKDVCINRYIEKESIFYEYDNNNNDNMLWSHLYFLKKKKKKKFDNFHYNDENVIKLLDFVSIINLHKYILNNITSFYIMSKYLFVLLDNGLLYYTKKNDDGKIYDFLELSNFYICYYKNINKIVDIKIINEHDIYYMDKKHILKNHSLKNNYLNIINTKEKIQSYNIFSMLENCTCIFLSLNDGSFYFINITKHKILLYENLQNFSNLGHNQIYCNFKKNKYIQYSVFNKLNEYIFNGYFYVQQYIIFFFLIYSTSHKKFFIYLVENIHIYILFKKIHQTNILYKNKEKNQNQNENIINMKRQKESSNYILYNFYLYKTLNKDYVCLLCSDKSVSYFYMFFFDLPREEEIKINIFFCSIKNTNIVYAKCIGNYMIVADYYLNITFYYIKDNFNNYYMSSGETPSSFFVPHKLEEPCVYKMKKKKEKQKYTYKLEEKINEDFVITEEGEKKSNKKIKNNTQHNDNNNNNDVFICNSLYELLLNKEKSFFLNIKHGKLKYINERMHTSELTYIDIVTTNNILICISFNSVDYPLEINPHINIRYMPYLNNDIQYYYPLIIKGNNNYENNNNNMYDLFLIKKKNFLLLRNNIKEDEEAIIKQKEKDHSTICNPKLIQNQQNDQTYNTKCVEENVFNVTINSNEHISFYLSKWIIEDNNTSYYINDSLIKNMNIVFLKIKNDISQNYTNRKRKNFFEDIVCMEKKYIENNKNNNEKMNIKISNMDKLNEEKTYILKDKNYIIHNKNTNYFFDNETIIFTFIKDNSSQNISLKKCLKIYQNKYYLQEKYEKKKKLEKKITYLRKQLNDLIKTNYQNEQMKIDRCTFFFDKKYINEEDILIYEYKKIKKKFKNTKKQKLYIINKLQKKCSILNKIDFLSAFKKNLYVVNFYNNQTGYKFYKIKCLRFLQIKEFFFLHNIDKNNTLFFLKDYTDYIDRYLQDFSSLYFYHYYPCTNINLNFLYANLFNVNPLQGEVDDLRWNYLLYSPYELFTNSRKRLQCYILKILIEQKKKKFQNDFEILKEEKNHCLKEINFLINKLKSSLQDVEKYMSYNFSYYMNMKLFIKNQPWYDKGRIYNIPDAIKKDLLLKIQLNKLNMETKKDINKENYILQTKYNEQKENINVDTSTQYYNLKHDMKNTPST